MDLWDLWDLCFFGAGLVERLMLQQTDLVLFVWSRCCAIQYKNASQIRRNALKYTWHRGDNPSTQLKLKFHLFHRFGYLWVLWEHSEHSASLWNFFTSKSHWVWASSATSSSPPSASPQRSCARNATRAVCGLKLPDSVVHCVQWFTALTFPSRSRSGEILQNGILTILTYFLPFFSRENDGEHW